MKLLRVDLGPRSYDIAIGASEPGLGEFAASRLRGRKCLVVSDGNVQMHAAAVATELTRAGFVAASGEVPPGEASKSLAEVERLYEALAAMSADRQTAVVAVGGGVIGDLAGFAAATYNRGLPLFMVPTSLLAMVDSSVGGKVGVNMPEGKNLVGAFHQPAGVWIDTAFLGSLPDREYRSGLAEVVKYGVILDEGFFAWLEQNAATVLERDAGAVGWIVQRSCELKALVVEKDEREETGLRAKLNYGHTFAHAFENVGGYGTMLHGEAVAAGMVCASRLAERLGLVGPEVTARQVSLLRRFGLPTASPEGDVDEWLSVMGRDKKAVGGSVRFVLPTRIGEVQSHGGVSEGDVRAVLNGAREVTMAEGALK